MFERKSNIIYLVFLSLCGLMLALLIGTKILKKDKTNFSENYNTTLKVGDYIIKATNATYISDKKEMYFYLSAKQETGTDLHTSSSPETSIISITFKDKDGKERKKRVLEKEKGTDDVTKTVINDMTKKYSVNDIDDDYIYIYIEIISVRDEYKEEDTRDEFNNIVEGKTHAKEEFKCVVVIDKTDIKVVSSEEDDSKVETTVSFEKPKETEKTSDNSSSVPDDNSSDNSSDSGAETTTTKSTDNSNSETSVSADTTTTAGITTTANGGNGGGNQTEKTSAATSKKEEKTTAATSKTTAKQSSQTTTKATTKSTTKATTKSTTKTTSAADKPIEFRTEPNVPVTLKLGKTTKIKVVYTPISYVPALKWESFDTSKVTVSQDGTVKAVGYGSTIIKVTDTKSGSTASVMVTVN